MSKDAFITSTANPRIKQIRKLRERKERQQSGLFLAEGLRIVIEAAHQGAPIQTVITAPGLLNSPIGQKTIRELRQKGVEILEVGDDVFKSLAQKDDPQGIAAVLLQQWMELEQVRVGSGELWVALDSVADPGNLGTILRTVDAVGGQGVILLDQSTDPYDPTAVRASMGALFSQKLVHVEFGQFAEWKKKHQIYITGTSDKARDDYHFSRYPSSLVLLMGSERHGLSEDTLALCDQVVRVPMNGINDSLNLAVATAIVLYEIFNQHRDPAREE
jgi:TrmH family RNA methyltransferase